MFWLLPRLLAGGLTLMLGAWVGAIVGKGLDAPLLSSVLGSTAALAALVALDSLRGYRLVRWLRGSRAEGAPLDSGLWGEVGYRLERSLRTLEADAERERARLSQFLSAIEASPNGVLLLDSKQQIEWCNSVAADHFGLDPKNDLHQPVTNLVRAPGFVACLRERRYDSAVTFPASSGRATLSVSVRRYGDGQLLVLSQDITERERTEAMRRDFVANVSHEIRTPLTVLSGFVETLGQLELTEAERQRSLALMAQQTQRMQTLVSDLLMLAQLEGSPLPPNQVWVAVTPLLDRAMADAKALSAGRHTLSLDAPAGVAVAGVEAELQSAIGNLLHNAVRYTPQGGNIQVRWRMHADGSGHVEVEDNGPGIAREHLPRIIERFYRVDSGRSRDTGGTGLGLAIVKHVVQRHGGELLIESELGRGSTFRLTFPAARVRVAQ